MIGRTAASGNAEARELVVDLAKHTHATPAEIRRAFPRRRRRPPPGLVHEWVAEARRTG